MPNFQNIFPEIAEGSDFLCGASYINKFMLDSRYEYGIISHYDGVLF